MFEAPPPRKKEALWTIVKVVLGILLIIIVASRTNLSDLRALPSQIDWGWLGWSLLLFALLTIVKAFQYLPMFSDKMTYRRVLNTIVLQNAISNLVANTAGIAAFLATLKAEQNLRLSRSALGLIVVKLGDLASISLALLTASLVLWNRIGALHGLIAGLLIVSGAGISSFFAVVLYRQRFVEKLGDLLAWTRLLHFRFVSRILEFSRALADLESTRIFSILTSSWGFSILYLLLLFGWIQSLFRAFSFSMAAWDIVFVTTILYLVSIVPIQILGGLGITEMTTLYFLILLGYDQGQAAAVLIGMRLLIYISNLVFLLYLPLDNFLSKRSSKRNHTS
jgi:uncharacterized membrane protein YbhN (UPF0104 family)